MAYTDSIGKSANTSSNLSATSITFSDGTSPFDEYTRGDQPIGAGADASVYVALANQEEQPDLCEKAFNTSAACREEVAIYKALSPHPNIVSFVGTSGDSIYMEMLSQRLGSMEENNATTGDVLAQRKHILLEVASGLKHIHTCRVTHNDINSKNIIIFSSEGGNPRAKIADFGGATHFKDGDEIIKPIPEEMLPFVTEMPTETLLGNIHTDTRDFSKLAYNILMGLGQDEMIPDDFRDQLLSKGYSEQICDAVSREKEGDPPSIDEWIELLS